MDMHDTFADPWWMPAVVLHHAGQRLEGIQIAASREPRFTKHGLLASHILTACPGFMTKKRKV